MTEPPISLRDVKARRAGRNGQGSIVVTAAERDALVEAVEAAQARSLKDGCCVVCLYAVANVPEFLHAEVCPMARFSFDTGASS